MKTSPASPLQAPASQPPRWHAAALTTILALSLLGASPAFSATASFIQKDTTTQGTWINASTGAKTYGTDGHQMLGVAASLPGYVSSIDTSAFSQHTWRADGTGNPTRDLQVPTDPYTSRQAVGWYTWGPSATATVTVTDNNPRLLAVYCEDPDADNRRQTLEIRDAATDTLLDSQALTSAFDQGVWLQWVITGNVKIAVILNPRGGSTAHMGYFFDSPTAPADPYTTWLGLYTFAAGADTTPTGDPDGDGISNLQEFAFGTQPTVSTGEIDYTGAVLNMPGVPKTVTAGGIYSMVFGKLATVPAGLTYTVQFSAGLDFWADNNDIINPPVQVATDGTINAMSVPYPDFITAPSGSPKPTFSCVKVVLAP